MEDLSATTAWLSAINRGPKALEAYLTRNGTDFHGHDGLGVLTWIQQQVPSSARQQDLLRVALSLGVPADGPPGAMVSPLLTATMRACLPSAQLLLSAGASPDHGGAGCVLPLEPIVDSMAHRTTTILASNAIMLAGCLLSAGANPNLPRRNGQPLLSPLIRQLPVNWGDASTTIGRFLDLFWRAGAHWQEGDDEALEGQRIWQGLPSHARALRANTQAQALDQATLPARGLARGCRL